MGVREVHFKILMLQQRNAKAAGGTKLELSHRSNPGNHIIPESYVKDKIAPLFFAGMAGGTALWVLLLLLWSFGFSVMPAQAIIGLRKKQKHQPSADVESLIDLCPPILKNLGFSGILGLITGITCKVSFRHTAIYEASRVRTSSDTELTESSN